MQKKVTVLNSKYNIKKNNLHCNKIAKFLKYDRHVFQECKQHQLKVGQLLIMTHFKQKNLFNYLAKQNSSYK